MLAAAKRQGERVVYPRRDIYGLTVMDYVSSVYCFVVFNAHPTVGDHKELFSDARRVVSINVSPEIVTDCYAYPTAGDFTEPFDAVRDCVANGLFRW